MLLLVPCNHLITLAISSLVMIFWLYSSSTSSYRPLKSLSIPAILFLRTRSNISLFLWLILGSIFTIFFVESFCFSFIITRMTELSNAIIEKKNGFERILRMLPPFDNRDLPEGNFGIGGLEILFLLKRNNRAIFFRISTAIHLPRVWEDLKGRVAESLRHGIDVIIPEAKGTTLGYYSPVQRYAGQPVVEECSYTEGPCYFDGSSIRAQGWYDAWLEHGTDRIWEKLEKEWKSVFGHFKLPEKIIESEQTFDDPMKGLEV